MTRPTGPRPEARGRRLGGGPTRAPRSHLPGAAIRLRQASRPARQEARRVARLRDRGPAVEERALDPLASFSVAFRQRFGQSHATIFVLDLDRAKACVFQTSDCRKTYEQPRARGVTFRSEPTERPYGIETIFQDDSGNGLSSTQRRGGARARAGELPTDPPARSPAQRGPAGSHRVASGPVAEDEVGALRSSAAR